MAEMVANCPRCGSKKITFDLRGQNFLYLQHDWQTWHEVLAACRHCGKGSLFVVSLENYGYRNFARDSGPVAYKGVVNDVFNIIDFVSQKDAAAAPPPEHLDEDIREAFNEGARSVTGGNPNAAGTMFRLAVDLATRPLLPKEEVPGLNAKVRRDLGLRLPWLFDNKLLPEGLRELSSCIKEDGNDGAHSGKLKKEDALDLQDFAHALLERMFTEPKRLALAKERRDARRDQK
jgi:hypothetical protein